MAPSGAGRGMGDSTPAAPPGAEQVDGPAEGSLRDQATPEGKHGASERSSGREAPSRRGLHKKHRIARHRITAALPAPGWLEPPLRPNLRVSRALQSRPRATAKFGNA
jgi:hypothetical protein